MKRIKTTVYLDAADYRKLKSLATYTGRRAAELVREAVAEYAARAKREWPRSFGMGYSGDPEFAANYEDALDRSGGDGIADPSRPAQPKTAPRRARSAKSGMGE